ncbi:MAG: hypothetical protein EOM64_10625 [Erysipelotrichia bacterium]|nr:hypothetical protein [Erysipelotrichia bacterium]
MIHWKHFLFWKKNTATEDKQNEKPCKAAPETPCPIIDAAEAMSLTNACDGVQTEKRCESDQEMTIPSLRMKLRTSQTIEEAERVAESIFEARQKERVKFGKTQQIRKFEQ